MISITFCLAIDNSFEPSSSFLGLPLFLLISLFNSLSSLLALLHDSLRISSRASWAQRTAWKGSVQRKASGQYSLTHSLIHLAPSPDTTSICESCCSLNDLKKPSSTLLPWFLPTHTTVLVSWFITVVMYLWPLL